MSFEEWDMNYHNKEIIDLRKEITNKELELLEKLEIIIQDKVYTGYEYGRLKMDLLLYYKDENMDEEEWKNVKSLKDREVNRNDYNELLNKFCELNKKYQKLFDYINV